MKELEILRQQTLTDAEILERVVALNSERAAEEAGGKVRWLRPDNQNPQGAKAMAQTVPIPNQCSQ